MAGPSKKIESDECSIWTQTNDDQTQITVGVLSGRPMTQDDFLDALQFFIDSVVSGEVTFSEDIVEGMRH